MTYSSWGNACRPCSRRSCRCRQCQLGPSSEGPRERASSYQSDNDPDFLRSANPADKRSRICGATCAWRPSHFPCSIRTNAKCNGLMATREIAATSRVRRGVAQTSCCRGLLIHAPLRCNLDQCVRPQAVQRHTDCKRQDPGISGPGRFSSVRHSRPSSPHDNRY
jgi:hypothetical protein